MEREKSDKGQHITTSLLQAQIFMLDFQAARYLVQGEVAKQAGNNHPTSIPTGVFKTKDGYINIAATGQKIWERFCEAAGATALLHKPEYQGGANRSKNRDALNAEIQSYMEKRTSADWVERLNAAGVPCGPIYAIDQMFADPQVKHLGMAQSVTKKDKSKMQLVGSAGDAVAHAVAFCGAAAEHRRTYQRSTQGVRLLGARHRRATQGESGIMRCHALRRRGIQQPANLKSGSKSPRLLDHPPSRMMTG